MGLFVSSLTNRIRIWRVPQGTAEQDVLCSGSPKSQELPPHRGGVLEVLAWPKDKHRKSRKVLLSTHCAILRFRLIWLEGPTASYPNVSFVFSAVRLESQIVQLYPLRTRLSPILPLSDFPEQLYHPMFPILDKAIRKRQKDCIGLVILFRRGQKRWYRGWLGLFPVLIRPQISTVFLPCNSLLSFVVIHEHCHWVVLEELAKLILMTDR